MTDTHSIGKIFSNRVSDKTPVEDNQQTGKGLEYIFLQRRYTKKAHEDAQNYYLLRKFKSKLQWDIT